MIIFKLLLLLLCSICVVCVCVCVCKNKLRNYILNSILKLIITHYVAKTWIKDKLNVRDSL